MNAVTWRGLLTTAEQALGRGMDARRILERASGYEGADLVLHLDDTAPARAVPFVEGMVERRAAGEPLQYVLGRWGFRGLELFVDRRVLIPRPETETLVDVALGELPPSDMKRRLLCVDLGTGSGAIALSLAAECARCDVWATDASARALAVARANLAGLGRGRAATRVRLAEGRWFDALPPGMRGTVDLVVSNPPYVAAGEALPREVADWEPMEALVAGPSGLEALAEILADAPDWLARPGRLVVEVASDRAEEAVDMARRAGFSSVEVRPDLTGRPRILVGRVREGRVARPSGEVTRVVLAREKERVTVVIVPAQGDPPPPHAIGAALEVLARGLPVAIPTDTVYGLAVDPSCAGATDRIFEVKRRPRDVSLPLLVCDIEQALSVATAVPDVARTLMDRLWPGPITLVLPSRLDLCADLGEDEATVGVRCPDHPVARSLCRLAGPLATTSANLHGNPTAATAAQVMEVFGDDVPLVLDAGPCRGSPSTVVDCTGQAPKLLREGRLPWEEVLRLIGRGP